MVIHYYGNYYVKLTILIYVCVTVPSRIKSVTSGGNIDTKKDSMIKLNCEADGNPVPNITWTRKVIYYIITKLSSITTY